MKLLIATDISPSSHWVIDAVKARPWPPGTEACLLHVVDLTPFPLGADLMETARQGAESAIRKIAESLAQSGLKVQSKVFLGAPRRAVPEYAKKCEADFVIVGSHGGTGLARFVLGSVAQSVVRYAPCSVEIVRHGASRTPAAEGFRVLLATDGSECSLAAARSVANRPWPAKTAIRVVSVVPPFVPIVDVSSAYFNASHAVMVTEAAEKAARVRAAEAIARASALYRESGISGVETIEPLFGDPKAVILDEAKEWGAGLIVVGSHGWRGVDRLMMGSVSESVAMHAPCSVEVIRKASSK
jgi:nucleotide-binding universal stress UspA family protein